MEKEKIVVSFSGGRTSAYMCWWLKNNMSHIWDFIFVYANTGLEHEKTLEFINNVDKYLNLELTWVEAVINKEKGIGTTYTIVDFNTCCRDNTLFKDMCNVYGLMNGTYIHCTRELKIQPITKFAQDYLGTKKFRTALGIRYDEPKRFKSDFFDYIQPLATILKITKKDVLEFWEKQPFDLGIEEHYGNCVCCYKKSDKKLKMIADENPHYFDAFIDLENNCSHIKTKKEIENNINHRIIYRGYRTALEVKKNLKLPINLSSVDECAEECGSVIPNSIFLNIDDMVYEKNLFDFME